MWNRVNSLRIDESQILSNDSLLWGPYRPNLYLGLQPRIPNSLLAGLMWSGADNLSNVLLSMYQVEQLDGTFY